MNKFTKTAFSTILLVSFQAYGVSTYNGKNFSDVSSLNSDYIINNTLGGSASIGTSDVISGSGFTFNNNNHNFVFNPNVIFQEFGHLKISDVIGQQVTRLQFSDKIFNDNKTAFFANLSNMKPNGIDSLQGLTATAFLDTSSTQSPWICSGDGCGGWSQTMTQQASLLDSNGAEVYQIVKGTESWSHNSQSETSDIEYIYKKASEYTPHTDMDGNPTAFYWSNPAIFRLEVAKVRNEEMGFGDSGGQGGTAETAINITTALNQLDAAHQLSTTTPQTNVAMHYAGTGVNIWQNKDQTYCLTSDCTSNVIAGIRDNPATADSAATWTKTDNDWGSSPTVSSSANSGGVFAKINTNKSVESAANDGIFSQILQYVFKRGHGEDDVGNTSIAGLSDNTITNITIHNTIDGDAANTTRGNKLKYTAWAPLSIYSSSTQDKIDAETHQAPCSGNEFSQNNQAYYRRTQTDSSIEFINVVFGKIADITNTMGTATYAGNIHGSAMNANTLALVNTTTGGTKYDVSGTMNMVANFGEATVTGNLNPIIQKAGVDSANISLAQIAISNGTVQKANSSFTAGLEGSGIAAGAKIKGNFYGTANNPAEIGGSFAFKTTGGVGGAGKDFLLSGIVVGKK